MIALGLLTTALLAACGGGDGGSESAAADSADSSDSSDTGGGGAELTVGMKEFEFDPAEITVEAGEVTITAQNNGVVEHDFSIEEADVKVYATGGEQTTETITLEPGTYTFFCSVPGHREAGMEGTLTAE